MTGAPLPLIGVTGRRLPGSRLTAIDSRYQVRDIDMYWSDYSRMIARYGGLPVQVPYDADPEAVVARLDGLLVTGGQDITPERWGGRPEHAEGDIDPARDAYELALVRAAERRGQPLLGICRGMQLINVARGGTLVPDLDRTPVDHRGEGSPVEHLVHPVDVMPNSLADSIFGSRIKVNSLHHQAVDRPGEGITISGRAHDGVPEIIEIDGLPVIGVQWHPEWMPHDDAAIGWLVHAARTPRGDLVKP